MKNCSPLVVGKTRRAALLAAPLFSLLLPGFLFGQPAAADRKDDPVKLEKFVVTGSYIPAAIDEANASPVVVVTAKEIDRTGVNKSILDVLRKAVPQIVGGLNIGVENANTGANSTQGGSQVALRNTTTLVLIDGLRATFSPVAGAGGYQFVDVNVVPVSAVERIEVLTDGASAIYGSDAVSGVVNVILKKNFQGLELGGSMSITPTDKGPHYRERTMHLVAGTSAGPTNLTISAEWAKQDPLFERDFNYTSPAFLSSSYAGVVNDNNGNFYRLNSSLQQAPTGPGVPTTLAGLAAAGIYVATPAANVPLGFDTSGRPTFSGALDKQIASIALQQAISDTLTFKSTVLYAKTLNNTNLNPQPIVLRVNSNAGNTGLPGIPFTDVRAQVRNRFLDAGNRNYSNDTSSLRATAELTGKLGSEWTWTADALYNNAKTISIAERQILQAALTTAINAGLINLTAIHQDPVKFAQANIFGEAFTIAESRLSSTNVRLNGRLFDLPAGPVYLAAGAGYRKETLAVRADANSTIDPATGTGLWNNGVTVNPFSEGRHITDEFLEVKVPITSPKNHLPGFYTMDLDIAVRHEKYSDIRKEKPTVPKASLRWLPFN
ncbi:MAG: TonB-dependent receptor plug domain-containing protein, partial [bacterium]|nr:TonB-dependent receptor plug domain-containing protein [bacterium]